jgi:acyl-CoA dehydrogenase
VDVRVPVGNVLGEIGGAFSSVASSSLRHRKIWYVARTAGSMSRLLELALAWSKDRVTYGKALAERENIQWMIAEGEVAVRATKLLCLHAASLHDRGLDSRHAIDAAKLYSAPVATKVADDVIQIHGAMGLAVEAGIERFYRQLRMWRLSGGSDEMQRRTVVRNLLNGTERVGNVV